MGRKTKRRAALGRAGWEMMSRCYIRLKTELRHGHTVTRVTCHAAAVTIRIYFFFRPFGPPSLPTTTPSTPSAKCTPPSGHPSGLPASLLFVIFLITLESFSVGPYSLLWPIFFAFFFFPRRRFFSAHRSFVLLGQSHICCHIFGPH